MFCTYCKTARVENEAPCPNCGAPSPLLKVSQHGDWGTGNPNGSSWGGPGASGASFREQWDQQQVPSFSFDKNNFSAPSWSAPEQKGSATSAPSWQQQAYDQNPMPSWQQPSSQPLSGNLDQANPMPSWQKTNSRPLTGNLGQASPTGPQQSLLPVPYQGGAALEPSGRQTTVSLQLVPDHAIEHLLPADSIQPDSVYIPPTFTKPRPLVPRYRIISGFLSVIVVALLLCSGAGYYAKASGTWDKVVRIYTGAAPSQSIAQNGGDIPDPPQQDPKKDFGPAHDNAIPSAVLAERIDTNTNFAIAQQNIFKPHEIFYLTFTVQPQDTNGQVNIKWYTNGKYYTKVASPIKASKVPMNGSAHMRLDDPASGFVEIYWNNQFAERLYFAVR